MAFTMSISASPATATAVRASISTPVRSAVRATAVSSTPRSVTVASTVTPCSPIGWHSGIRSGVRLAPAIPAILATASASPLGTAPARSAATASAASSTRPVAQAERAVTSLPDTSTIRAWPALSTCVRRPGDAISLTLPLYFYAERTVVARRAQPCVRSGQDEDVGALARGHLDHPFGHDDQRVGLAQRGHLMRALASQRLDPPGRAVQHPAQERAPPGRGAQRPGHLSLDHLQAEAVIGLQRGQRGPDEDLERHIRADRVAGQREDRHLTVAGTR